MGTVAHEFRGAVFGGFDRRDVMEYFDRFAREKDQRIGELTAGLEQAAREKEALEAQLDSLRSENGDWAEQEARVRASLEESSRSLTGLRGELQTARTELAEAQRELAVLRERVAALEPMARQYETLRDRVATVELDAHQKAQLTLDAARVEAEALRGETARWMGEVRKGYDRLREQVRDCAQTAARAEETFIALDGEYQELLKRGLGEE